MNIRYSLVLALLLVPALSLSGCGRKPDPDVNVIILDAEERSMAGGT